MEEMGNGKEIKNEGRYMTGMEERREEKICGEWRKNVWEGMREERKNVLGKDGKYMNEWNNEGIESF